MVLVDALGELFSPKGAPSQFVRVTAFGKQQVILSKLEPLNLLVGSVDPLDDGQIVDGRSPARRSRVLRLRNGEITSPGSEE